MTDIYGKIHEKPILTYRCIKLVENHYILMFSDWQVKFHSWERISKEAERPRKCGNRRKARWKDTNRKTLPIFKSL